MTLRVLETTGGVSEGDGVTEDDLRTMLREFRSSVAEDLDAQNRRIATFTEEMRRRFTQIEERVASLERTVSTLDERLGQVDERIRIAEMAILSEIRAMSDRIDRRFKRLGEDQ